MKKSIAILSQIFVIGVFILNGLTAGLSSAQVKSLHQFDLAYDYRPFDFSDKYYEENGVEPALIVNRRNGDDKLSVFGFTRDERFRNVRITGTFPAYDRDGNLLYFNLYGELFEQSFIQSPTGAEALDIAHRYPIFTFPSEAAGGGERQAALIETDDAYFEKNVLGLGVYVTVSYTDNIHTKEGEAFLAALAEKNGLSYDGTPIIRTSKEINDLNRRELVKVSFANAADKTRPPFAIAKVIADPQKGAIAPDAFLIFVTTPNTTKPLPAEEIFVNKFECLKQSNNICGIK